MAKHWILGRAIAAVILANALGCDATDDFRTEPGEVFYGGIIGSDSSEAMPSFIREGFPSHTEMELTFDPERALAYSDAGTVAGKPVSAGTLHTYQCPSGITHCPKADRTQGTFDHAPLERIGPLTNDALSQYDFPGGGRLRNYIFNARGNTHVDERVLQRSATVFLSLMENGKIEVRVIAPSALDATSQEEIAPALFGVFALERRKL